MPLFTARRGHFDHLHGTCLSPAALSVCHSNTADMCILASVAGCLPRAILAREGRPHSITSDDQSMSGPIPYFRVGVKKKKERKKNSLFDKIEILF